MVKQQQSITLDDDIHASLEHQSQKTGLAISQLISLRLKGFVIHNRILLDSEIMIQNFAVNVNGYYVKINHNDFDGYEATWEGICSSCQKKKSFLGKERTLDSILETTKFLLDYHDCEKETD